MGQDLRGNPLVSWVETGGASLGEQLMLNTGEYPNDVVESTLSQILQENVPTKYYLSVRACQGILNRAKRRGKQLPQMLEEALMEVCATAFKETESTGQTAPDATEKDGKRIAAIR
jgi:hypothetical protein